MTCLLEAHTHSADCAVIPVDSVDELDNASGIGQNVSDGDILTCSLAEHVHGEDCYEADSGGTALSTELNAQDSLIQATAEASLEANVIPGMTPSNTVINLYDYWVTDNETPPTDDYSSDPDYVWDLGINKNHELKFRKSSGNLDAYNVKANQYTGGGKGPCTGIVQNTLGDDGYPVTSTTGTGFTQSESLAYLFNASSIDNSANLQIGKRAYMNVGGLLQQDELGYYYYDSTRNYAYYERDETLNPDRMVTLYDQVGGVYDTINGQFFPFNDITDARTVNGSNVTLTKAGSKIFNHYFGLSMTTRFTQDFDGHTSSARDIDTVFEFSGDDDAWIFIDGVLVSDIGGIHDAVSTTINFATGAITVDGVQVSTIYQQFAKAGRTGSVSWNEGNTTFASGTTHTLKFYYLERGNNASNMSLKSNLRDTPRTVIQKQDQYGNPLTGVTFAVYPASLADPNGDFEMSGANYRLVDRSGSLIDPSDITAEMESADGILRVGTDESNWIDPCYYGTTDEDGTIVFIDKETYTTLSASEIKEKTGQFFIIRELQTPDGYRSVSDNICLYWIEDHLLVPNTFETGVLASSNVLVTANNQIEVVTGTDADGNVTTRTVQYATLDTSGPTVSYQSEGTLFAVVLKRNGQALSDYENTWYPVCGNDYRGYKTLNPGIENILEAAMINLTEYGIDTSFTTGIGGMQVLLEYLPGDISRYYSYILEHGGGIDAIVSGGDLNPQFAVAYFYTNADSLEEAYEKYGVEGSGITVERVVSHDDKSSIFSLSWSSTIEISNMENRLYFQKTDAFGNLVDGARFALYEVEEKIETTTDEAGKTITDFIYFYTARLESDSRKSVKVRLMKDADADSRGEAIILTDAGERAGSYAVNALTGEITVTADGEIWVIAPAENADAESLVGLTRAEADESLSLEAGTGYFPKLREGCYILREIEAPELYQINPEEVRVLVESENGVLANAGTKDDGVLVGNGVGLLPPGLMNYATHNDIDETLTWLYALLRVNTADESFSAVSSYVSRYTQAIEAGSNWRYASPSGPDSPGFALGSTADRTQAMVTYLEYGDLNETEFQLFDYIANSDQRARSSVIPSDPSLVNRYPTRDGEGTLRLFNEEGWGILAVHQDYSYGIQNRSMIGTAAVTNYTNLTSQNAFGQEDVNLNLAHLFSNSTFVRVSDPKTVEIQIEKIDAVSGRTLTGAGFVLYQIDEDGERRYYQENKDETVSWVRIGENPEEDLEECSDETSEMDLTRTTGQDGRITWAGLTEGVYVLKETAAPLGYQALESVQIWKLTETQTGFLLEVTNSESGEDESPKVFVVTYTEEEDGSLSVTTESDGVITDGWPLLQIENHPKQLPSTGGRGRGGWLFFALGLIIVGVLLRRRPSGRKML